MPTYELGIRKPGSVKQHCLLSMAVANTVMPPRLPSSAQQLDGPYKTHINVFEPRPPEGKAAILSFLLF